MPKGIPLTAEVIDRRRHEIFRASITSIIQQGFNETSMQEIAEAAGLRKSTLYDYFPTKDDVLLFIYEEELEELQIAADLVIQESIPAREKLLKILETNLTRLLDNKNFLIEMSLQAQRLSQASRRRIQQKRHVYQDLLRGVIEQGVQEGAFRPVNTRLAARTLLSMIEVLVYTTRPTGTPQEMLRDAMDIFLQGIENKSAQSTISQEE